MSARDRDLNIPAHQIFELIGDEYRDLAEILQDRIDEHRECGFHDVANTLQPLANSLKRDSKRFYERSARTQA